MPQRCGARVAVRMSMTWQRGAQACHRACVGALSCGCTTRRERLTGLCPAAPSQQQAFPGPALLLPPGRVLHIRPRARPPSAPSPEPSCHNASRNNAGSLSAAHAAYPTPAARHSSRPPEHPSTTSGRAAAQPEPSPEQPRHDAAQEPRARQEPPLGAGRADVSAWPSEPGAAYELVELPPGAGLGRLLLGRAALHEHRSRAYRRVLSQLAGHEPGA